MAFELHVGAYRFLATHKLIGDRHSIAVGFPRRGSGASVELDVNTACVRIEYDESLPGLVSLAWAGWNEACADWGAPLKRGREGTVPMVMAALKYALDALPHAWHDIEMMDTSTLECDLPQTADEVRRRSRRVASICLADFYAATHAHGQTWYEHHLGAVVDARFERRLAHNRRALASRPSQSVSAAFVDAVAVAARLQGDRLWFEQCRDDLSRILGASRSWSDFFRDALARFGCPMIDLMCPILPEFLPEWTTMCGWRWTIPRETVRRYDVDVRLPSTSVQTGGQAGGHYAHFTVGGRQWSWHDRMIGARVYSKRN